MVVPMRLAATMRFKLFGVGGADAAEAMCATSSCAVGTGTCSHTVGTRTSRAHVAVQHSSGGGYACCHHVCRCSAPLDRLLGRGGRRPDVPRSGTITPAPACC